jgi:hypothetical protein
MAASAAPFPEKGTDFKIKAPPCTSIFQFRNEPEERRRWSGLKGRKRSV